MPGDRNNQRLLLALARDPVDSANLRALAAAVTQWDAFVDLALQHRVLPMTFLRLSDIGPSIPPSVQTRIGQEYERIAIHNLASAAELVSILGMFSREAIAAMPFKGIVLAASAYGNLLARSAGDIDLLVRFRDIARATELLRARGYEMETSIRADGTPEIPGCFEYSFHRRADGMVVEMRWRLDMSWRRFGRDLGLDWAWPHRRTVLLAGAEVPDIDPEILLLILCMHGSKHVWSRLVWICDVAKLLAASPALDWPMVLSEAARLGLGRPVRLGVLLAHRIAGATVPPEILRRCASDRTASRLARHFESHLFENPGMGPPGRLPYNLQILDFRDLVRFLRSPQFLQPNQRDRALFPLPRGLTWLYYLLRPFRILLDRSPR